MKARTFMSESWTLSPEPRRPWLTVFVPAFNEREGLAQSVWRVMAVLDRFGVAAEILIVNDASTDDTGLVAAALADLDPRVRCITHPINRGLGSGLTTAIAEARGDWLILVPADLAIDPVDLRRYFESSSNADIVVGVADVHVDYSWFRRLVHAANIRVVQILFGMRERQFQYICLYRLAVLRMLQIEYIRSAFFHAEVLIKAKALGARLSEVDVRYRPRLTGEAGGARSTLIVHTLRDMADFWLRGGAEAVRRQAAPSRRSLG
ncbi:MAG: glycosyltransferase family 2 protein [Anaerolineales bacterium]|nr:glycosyltransferase family 2 protein [Anaerolineales bacterium]